MLRWLKKAVGVEASPFVQHIIDSLADNPESWTLEESEEIADWKSCSHDHPDAVKKGYGDWRRPVMRFVFRLKHTGGTIVVINHDASDYLGWVIEEPRHAAITEYDSDLLSEAVKKWREHMVLHELTQHTPERKLLAEAMAEVENL